MEGRAPPDARTLGIHAPAHGGDAVGGPVQPYTAGLRLLGAETAAEQVLHDVRIDAIAVVLDGQVDAFAAIVDLEDGINVDAAADPPRFLDRLGGVDHQITENLGYDDRMALHRGHRIDRRR